MWTGELPQDIRTDARTTQASTARSAACFPASEAPTGPPALDGDGGFRGAAPAQEGPAGGHGKGVLERPFIRFVKP